MSKLQAEIDELSEQVKRLERTTNPTDLHMQTMLAMRQELAAMRQKEVLLLQSEAA